MLAQVGFFYTQFQNLSFFAAAKNLFVGREIFAAAKNDRAAFRMTDGGIMRCKTYLCKRCGQREDSCGRSLVGHLKTSCKNHPHPMPASFNTPIHPLLAPSKYAILFLRPPQGAPLSKPIAPPILLFHHHPPTVQPSKKRSQMSRCPDVANVHFNSKSQMSQSRKLSPFLTVTTVTTVLFRSKVPGDRRP